MLLFVRRNNELKTHKLENHLKSKPASLLNNNKPQGVQQHNVKLKQQKTYVQTIARELPSFHQQFQSSCEYSAEYFKNKIKGVLSKSHLSPNPLPFIRIKTMKVN